MAFNLTPIDGETIIINNQGFVYDLPNKIWKKVNKEKYKFEFISIADQTVFDGRDENDLILEVPLEHKDIDIFQQGDLLMQNDYILTDANTLTFVAPIPLGHEIIILCKLALQPDVYQPV